MWGVAFDSEDYSVVRNGSKVLDDQFRKRRSVVAVARQGVLSDDGLHVAPCVQFPDGSVIIIGQNKAPFDVLQLLCQSLVVLGLKRAVVIPLRANIGRVEVKKGVLSVIHPDQVSEVLVFDIDTPQALLDLFQVCGGVVNRSGAGGVGALITAEADLDGIEEPRRPLDVGQAASVQLCQAIKELFPGSQHPVQFLLYLAAVIFYTAEQVHQAPVDVVVDLQLVRNLIFAKKHPSSAAEHLNIAAYAICGESGNDLLPQLALAANPTKKAIQYASSFRFWGD